MQRVVVWAMAAFLAVEAVALGFRLANASAPYDDAFITFRYARNLAEGRGFVYNPGDRVLGTTTPAYGLLLGAVAAATGWDPARQANWFSACAIAVMAWFAFLLVAADFGLLAGVTAGLSVALNPMIISSWGGEWLVAAAALAAGFYLYRIGRLVPAAVALSLAILFRSETAMAAALVCGDALIERKPGMWRATGVAAVIGLGWVVIAGLVVGHILPGTLGAKLAHGQSHLFGTLLGGFLRGARQFLLADYRMAAIALLAWHGVLVAALKGGVWRLIALWIAAYLAFFAAFHFPFYHWYLVPIAFAISVAAGIGVVAVDLYTRALFRRRLLGRVVAAVAVVVLAMSTILAEASSSRAWVRSKPDPRERMYNNVGAWLANRTPPDASVAYLEVGRIGYFSRRRIIDLMGLVTPGVAERVANQDLLWAVYEYKPDYYLVGSTFTWAGSAASEPWFQGAYEEIERFKAPDLDMVLTLYRKLPGAAFPEPRRIEGAQLVPRAIVGEIVPGTTHGQTFTATRDGLAAVATMFATFSRVNRGTMWLRLEQVEPPATVYATEFRMEEVADNQWRVIEFSPVVGSAGRRYRLTIGAVDAVPGNAVTLWFDPRDSYGGGERLVSGRPSSGDLTLKLVYVSGS